MSLKLKQYNKTSSMSDEGFLTAITSNWTLSSATKVTYIDNFNTSNGYYFHCKIKMGTNSQKYYLQLISSDTSVTVYQYVKTITVPAGTGWFDVEAIFSPLGGQFDTLYLEYVATSAAQSLGTDFTPVIAFVEMSIINNLLTSKLSVPAGGVLVKMAIQGTAKMLFSINHEEFSLSTAGTFELYDGIIYVEDLGIIAPLVKEIEYDDITESTIFFSLNGTRTNNSFIIDYVYEEA